VYHFFGCDVKKSIKILFGLATLKTYSCLFSCSLSIPTVQRLIVASALYAMSQHPEEKFTVLTMVAFVATVAGPSSGEHTKKLKLQSCVANKVNII